MAEVLARDTVPELRTTNKARPQRRTRASEADSQNAEAQARLLLHQNGADIKFGSQIERRKDGIVVRVIVATPEQAEELKTLLSTVPRVAAQVWTPETIPASPDEIPMHAVESPEAPLHRTEALMGNELAHCLGSTAEANSFVSRIHNTMHQAMVPAIALEELARRYRGMDYELLNPKAQAGIDQIAADHLSKIREYANRLSADVGPVLEGCVGWTHVAGHVPIMQAPGTAQSPENWRQSGLTITRPFRQFDRYFNLLFTTQVTPDEPVSSKQAIGGLANARADLERAARDVYGAPPSSQKAKVN
jgi:hypothetical protein